MTDLIVIFVILAVLGVCAGFIIRKKKHGAACIGCPYASKCASKKTGCHTGK